MDFEEYYFNSIDERINDQLFVLIIYDIVDNAKRVKLAKKLQGYGFRVQKSAFEAMITKKKYDKMLSELELYVDEEDSIRVYKIIGKGQLKVLGKQEQHTLDHIIVV